MKPKADARVRRWARAGATLFALLVAGGATASAPADDLLEPESAFRSSARRVDLKTIEVRFAVAPGYYLYRQRFHAVLDGQAVPKRALRLPKGRMKQDPNFGLVETYRNSVRLLIPVPPAVGTSAVLLDVTSQGCADSGVCYPPLKQRFRLLADGGTNDRPETLSGSGFPHQSPASSLKQSLTR